MKALNYLMKSVLVTVMVTVILTVGMSSCRKSDEAKPSTAMVANAIAGSAEASAATISLNDALDETMSKILNPLDSVFFASFNFVLEESSNVYITCLSETILYQDTGKIR